MEEVLRAKHHEKLVLWEEDGSNAPLVDCPVTITATMSFTRDKVLRVTKEK